MGKKFEIKLDQVPISEKTFSGAHLNSDDIHIFCRILSIWSDPLEEEFENINESINGLRKEVGELKTQIKEITKTVDCTKVEVELIKGELNKLKKVNSWWHISGRWISGVAAAVLIAYYLFINYWSK